jgi:hypothetical protein
VESYLVLGEGFKVCFKLVGSFFGVEADTGVPAVGEMHFEIFLDYFYFLLIF